MINWSIAIKDLKHLASGLNSAKGLRNAFCQAEKSSTWKMVGRCGYCGGNIVYRIYAVWANGSIIRHSHNLDDAECPHCEGRLGPHAVHHDGAHSHEA